MFKKGQKVTTVSKFGLWKSLNGVTGDIGEIVEKVVGKPQYLVKFPTSYGTDSFLVHEGNLRELPEEPNVCTETVLGTAKSCNLGKQDFETQADVWDYLLTGGMVLAHNKTVMMLRDGEVHALMSGSWYPQKGPSFYNYSDFAKYTEPKWYENIPATGILCWCWGSFPEEQGQLDIVVGYKVAGNVYPFADNSGTSWINARPATMEEAATLIYKYEK